MTTQTNSYLIEAFGSALAWAPLSHFNGTQEQAIAHLETLAREYPRMAFRASLDGKLVASRGMGTDQTPAKNWPVTYRCEGKPLRRKASLAKASRKLAKIAGL